MAKKNKRKNKKECVKVPNMSHGRMRIYEPKKRIQRRDYKGRRYDVHELPFHPEYFEKLNHPSKFWLPEEEHVYVEGRVWTIES